MAAAAAACVAASSPVTAALVKPAAARPQPRSSSSTRRQALRAARVTPARAEASRGTSAGAVQQVWDAASISAVMAPQRGQDTSDPMALLLSQRIVFLGGQVDDFSADAVVSQMLLLDAQDPTKDIRLFINSPGGSVTAGMGIYDAMQLCQADVSTVCFGLAASMGAFLLCAGAKGKRYAMPNARIMIHQPLGGISGQADDMEIQAKEILFHKENLQQIMAYHSGQPVERIAKDTDRDFYMNPKECIKYGMIDHIIGNDSKGVVAPDGTTQNVKFDPFEPEPTEYMKKRMARWPFEMPDDLDMTKPAS
eukprot:jgi/Chlat1/9070/Chrsp94S00706